MSDHLHHAAPEPRPAAGTFADRAERLAEWVDFGDDFGWRLLGVGLLFACIVAFFAVCGYVGGGGADFLRSLAACAGY